MKTNLNMKSLHNLYSVVATLFLLSVGMGQVWGQVIPNPGDDLSQYEITMSSSASSSITDGEWYIACYNNSKSGYLYSDGSSWSAHSFSESEYAHLLVRFNSSGSSRSIQSFNSNYLYISYVWYVVEYAWNIESSSTEKVLNFSNSGSNYCIYRTSDVMKKAGCLRFNNNELSVASSNNTTSYEKWNFYKVAFRRKTTTTFAQTSCETDGNHYIQTATLSPSEAGSLKYSVTSGNATIDENTGKITPSAKGSVTVKATFEGNDEYAPSEATYTVNFTKTPAFLYFDGMEEKEYEVNYSSNKSFNTSVSMSPVDYRWKGITFTLSENNCGATIAQDNAYYLLINYASIGSVKVTASFAGDDTYTACSASFILNVTKNQPIIKFQDAKVTKQFNNSDSSQNYNIQTINSVDPDWAKNYSTIVYSLGSDNTCGATINSSTGRVDFSQAGKVTVIATYPANDLCEEATASYELTVTGTQTLSVNPISATISVDETQEIMVTSKNTNADISYSLSSDPTVTVTNESSYDSEGIRYLVLTVKGTSCGLSHITFSQGTIQVQSEITVVKKTPEFTIQATPSTIYIGETSQLSIASNTGDGTSVTYSAASTAVTISGSTVTASQVNADTQVTITGVLAATDKCNEATATTTITVKALMSASLSASVANSSVEIDGQTTLTVQSYSGGDVTYSGYDASVISIEGTGKEVTINALAAGSTTITVSQAADGHYAASQTTVAIEVVKKTATASVSPADVTIKVGGTQTLTLTTVSDGEVSFRSGNIEIATLESSGKTATVTGLAEGEVEIYYSVASSATYESIPEAYITISVVDKYTFRLGQFVRLKGKATNTYAKSEATSDGNMQHTTSASDNSTIIYCEPTGNTTTIAETVYSTSKLLFYDKGQYTTATSQLAELGATTTASTYVFLESNTQGVFTIMSDASTNSYLNDGTSNVTSSSSANGDNTLWQVEIVNALPVTILAEQYSGGYATLCCPVALQVPSGITAYNVGGKIGSGEGAACDYSLVLERISNIIPANTPVVLNGTPGNYNFPLLYNNEDNALQPAPGFKGTIPTILTSSQTPIGSVYTLQHHSTNSNTGFYLWAGDNTSTGNGIADNRTYIHGFRAYFVEPSSGGTSAPGFSFVISDDPAGNTTGIVNVNDSYGFDSLSSGNGPAVFDLQGCKVQHPRAGQLYIVNGKKVQFR